MLYKALSIKQPWAWLIVHGYKDIENRYWPTDFRGWFYIHSPKKIDQTAYNMITKYNEIYIPRDHQLRTGGIIGKAKLTDCVNSSSSSWFVGPYGFKLRRQRPVKFIPLKGQQYFFDFNYSRRLIQ